MRTGEICCLPAFCLAFMAGGRSLLRGRAARPPGSHAPGWRVPITPKSKDHRVNLGCLWGVYQLGMLRALARLLRLAGQGVAGVAMVGWGRKAAAGGAMSR